MSQISEKRLFEIAMAQQGYFRSQQAIQAGYQINNHPYHIKRGHWIREWRGIYRLANFPNHPEDQYVLWSLWSCNRHGEPQGVYSFDTALNIYDVSDIMPTKLHMTVPRTFRRSSEIPLPLVLHRGALSEKDYQVMRGFRVTTPRRTFLDVVLAEQIEDHLIQQAARAFIHRGLLTRGDVLRVIEQVPKAASFFIDKNKRSENA
jgi:predicted transcriptional regulator of viral defense system